MLLPCSQTGKHEARLLTQNVGEAQWEKRGLPPIPKPMQFYLAEDLGVPPQKAKGSFISNKTDSLAKQPIPGSKIRFHYMHTKSF